MQHLFNSIYYPMLYRQRNEAEAEFFILNLLKFLRPKPDSKMLDLACGWGRYSVCLNKRKYKVWGVDSSIASIEFCRQFENPTMKFSIHDMRAVFRKNFFDYVFNFFTSFGYFETEEENFKVISSVSDCLKPGGVFVLDFFNAGFAKKNMIEKERKTFGHICFHITRKFKGDFMIKDIVFKDGSKNFHFIEKVRLFELADFENFFSCAGLKLEKLFGDYATNPFELEESERVIMVARKL